MAYVYKHIRKDNKKPFYIGVGGLLTFDNYQRANANNWKGLKSRSDFWHNYVNLYGFEVEIILDNCTKEEAYLKETELISFYGRQDISTGILVNHTNGGDGGKGRSELTKLKCGIKNKGKKASLEVRLKMSESQKTRGKDSFETRLKKSLSSKGRKKSKGHTEKIRMNSAFKQGNIPWNYGKKYNNKGKGYIILNLETGIFYNSISEASNYVNNSFSTFRSMILGLIENKTSFILTNG